MCAHESVWCRSTLNISTSPLPIMHCGKGNTHCVYLEEARDGNYQPEEKRNPNQSQKNRKEFAFGLSSLDKSQLLFFSVKVDFKDTLVTFTDTLDTFIDTLDFVSLPLGITKV